MILQQIQNAIRQMQQTGFSFKRMAAVAAGLAICCEAILLMQKGPAGESPVPRYDRICKVSLDARFGEMEGLMSKTPAQAAEALIAGLQEIETATRAYSPGDIAVQRETPVETPALEKMPRVLAVDDNFTDVFHFKIVAGCIENCLQNSTSVVLTESMAAKLFGTAAGAVGRPLLIGKMEGHVTTVVADQLQNAPVLFDVLVPMSNFKVVQRNEWNWTWLKVDTWVRLHDQPIAENIAAVEAQLPDLVRDYATPAFERIGADFDEMIKNGGRWDLRLQPLSTPVVPEIAANTGMAAPAKRVTFGVLGFHLKNLL